MRRSPGIAVSVSGSTAGRKFPIRPRVFNHEDVHGPSEVIDPHAFDWQDEAWRGRPWEEAVIYELHVGAFTPDRNFCGGRANDSTIWRIWASPRSS